jgi:glutamine---fructose-6-phosphate transaminase (isomerizing)
VTRPAFADAIRAQPAALRHALTVTRRWPAFDPGGLLVVFGMGASAHAARGFAAGLRQAGRPAVALSASSTLPGGAGGYLAISQSGRSRETFEALASVPGPVAVLTNDPDSPVGRAGAVVLELGCGADSRVSSLSYTATVQALGVLAGRLGASPAVDWAGLPDVVAALLELDVRTAVTSFTRVSHVDVIGSGVHAASAGAAGLVLREAARLPTAAYPAREYLHGALEATGPGRGALVFDDADLAATLAAYGTAVVLVTAADVPAAPGLCVVRVPPLAALAAAVAAIVPVQLMAAGLAAHHGHEIALRYMPSSTKLP